MAVIDAIAGRLMPHDAPRRTIAVFAAFAIFYAPHFILPFRQIFSPIMPRFRAAVFFYCRC